MLGLKRILFPEEPAQVRSRKVISSNPVGGDSLASLFDSSDKSTKKYRRGKRQRDDAFVSVLMTLDNIKLPPNQAIVSQAPMANIKSTTRAIPTDSLACLGRTTVVTAVSPHPYDERSLPRAKRSTGYANISTRSKPTHKGQSNLAGKLTAHNAGRVSKQAREYLFKLSKGKTRGGSLLVPTMDVLNKNSSPSLSESKNDENGVSKRAAHPQRSNSIPKQTKLAANRKKGRGSRKAQREVLAGISMNTQSGGLGALFGLNSDKPVGVDTTRVTKSKKHNVPPRITLIHRCVSPTDSLCSKEISITSGKERIRPDDIGQHGMKTLSSQQPESSLHRGSDQRGCESRNSKTGEEISEVDPRSLPLLTYEGGASVARKCSAANIQQPFETSSDERSMLIKGRQSNQSGIVTSESEEIILHGKQWADKTSRKTNLYHHSTYNIYLPVSGSLEEESKLSTVQRPEPQLETSKPKRGTLRRSKLRLSSENESHYEEPVNSMVVFETKVSQESSKVGVERSKKRETDLLAASKTPNNMNGKKGVKRQRPWVKVSSRCPSSKGGIGSYAIDVEIADLNAFKKHRKEIPETLKDTAEAETSPASSNYTPDETSNLRRSRRSVARPDRLGACVPESTCKEKLDSTPCPNRHDQVKKPNERSDMSSNNYDPAEPETVRRRRKTEKGGIPFDKSQNTAFSNDDGRRNSEVDTRSGEWGAREEFLLREAHKEVDPKSVSFWEDVSDMVEGGKTSVDCREKWFSLAKTPIAPNRKLKKQIIADCPPTPADDDIFNATPMKAMFSVDMSEMPISFFGNIGNLTNLGIGSAIKVGRGTAAPSMPPPNPSQRGYKTYIKAMKRGVNVKRGNLPPKALKKTSKSGKNLAVRADEGDVQIKGRLSPGGTLRLNTKEVQDLEDTYLDFADENDLDD